MGHVRALHLKNSAVGGLPVVCRRAMKTGKLVNSMCRAVTVDGASTLHMETHEPSAVSAGALFLHVHHGLQPNVPVLRRQRVACDVVCEPPPTKLHEAVQERSKHWVHP